MLRHVSKAHVLAQSIDVAKSAILTGHQQFRNRSNYFYNLKWNYLAQQLPMVSFVHMPYHCASNNGLHVIHRHLLQTSSRCFVEQRSRPKVQNQAVIVTDKRTLTLSAKAIVEASPVYIQPYLRLIRLDRPIGTWLTFLPSVWSLSLATPIGHVPDVKLVSLFALGAFFMRSAGCAVNDVFDKDFDSQVERTKNRPVACGEISQFKALAFLALPLSGALAVLLQLNWNTIMLGTLALIPVAVYPLMKRVTYWPQAFLGLTFNYGVVLGWSAVKGLIDLPVVPMYVAAIGWTLVYDTIYAFQDRKDDVVAGVKSTAIKFGENTKLWLSGFAALTATGLTATGVMADQPWLYYVGVAAFTSHLAHQIRTVDLTNVDDCGAKFRSNRNAGLMFWAFIVAAGLFGNASTSAAAAAVERGDGAQSKCELVNSDTGDR